MIESGTVVIVNGFGQNKRGDSPLLSLIYFPIKRLERL